MEAVGTFFLVLSVGLTGNAFAIGLLLAALVFGGAHISGAHFNPAISFAFFLKKEINFNTFIGYVISQILGVFAASGVYLMLSSLVFYVEPPASTTIYQQTTVELLATFVLVFVYLNAFPSKHLKQNRSAGLIIGVTLTSLILMSEDISGGVFNPAISVGASLLDLISINGASYKYIPIYTLAPVTGSVLATYLYKYLND